MAEEGSRPPRRNGGGVVMADTAVGEGGYGVRRAAEEEIGMLNN